MTELASVPGRPDTGRKSDRGEVFVEYTKAICPVCKTVMDGQVNVRDEGVSCASARGSTAWFEARRLLATPSSTWRSPAVRQARGRSPLERQTEVGARLPARTAGICPEHAQHTCLGIIEVNTGCNLDCPICFADSGTGPQEHGYSLTLEQVEAMLDAFVARGGRTRGGAVLGRRAVDPPRDPRDAGRRQATAGSRSVMLNTNGIRLARDPRFARGARRDRRRTSTSSSTASTRQTHMAIRGTRPDATRSSGRSTAAPRPGCRSRSSPRSSATSTSDEVGRDRPLRRRAPGGRGVVFQPVTHSGRFRAEFDPLDQADQLRRDRRARRAAPGVVPRRRLRPGPVLLADLPLDRPSRLVRRRGPRPAPAPRRRRAVPRLRHQPRCPDLGGAGGAGGAVVGEGGRPAARSVPRALECVACGDWRCRRELREVAARGVHDRRSRTSRTRTRSTSAADEVLRRGDRARRAADPVLRLQLGRLPRAGAGPVSGVPVADVVPNAVGLRRCWHRPARVTTAAGRLRPAAQVRSDGSRPPPPTSAT